MTCSVCLVYSVNDVTADSVAGSHVEEHKLVKQRSREKQRQLENMPCHSNTT